MTVAELKKLWEPAAQGKIMRWSQIRAGWPDREIHLFGPGVDSGTFDYFTEAIIGKADQSRGDYTSSEDDNVIVQGVSGDELALGYFGFAYYEENQDKLKLVPVDDGNEANGAGPILPSPRDGEGRHAMRRCPGPSSSIRKVKSLDRPEVKSFVDFYPVGRRCRWSGRSATFRSATRNTSWCGPASQRGRRGSMYQGDRQSQHASRSSSVSRSSRS